MQRELWLSTLPLGRDVAQRRKKYVSKNVGDTIPLIGPSCGSPTGIPFFLAEGVRTLEHFNPWDRAFLNGLMVINGVQGSGKTMAGILTAARLLAYGVNVTVLDRSGHWELLDPARARRRAPVDRRRLKPRDDQPLGRHRPRTACARRRSRSCATCTSC